MEQLVAKQPVFCIRSPDHILVADKSLAEGGVPRKMYLPEIKATFGFDYCEDIFCDPAIQYPFAEKLPPLVSLEMVQGKIEKALREPMNDSLVICKIDEKVGYGVFAKKRINAGTIIGVYAGEINSQKEVETYAMGLGKTPYRIDAKNIGGLTRFIQHMPYSMAVIKEAILSKAQNLDELLEILDGNSLYFDEEEIVSMRSQVRRDPTFIRRTAIANVEYLEGLGSNLQEELQVYDFLKRFESNIAVANVQAFLHMHGNKPVLYARAILDIEANQQLGLSYGLEYWQKRKIFPEYFHKTKGTIIPRRVYLPGGAEQIDVKTLHDPAVTRMQTQVYFENTNSSESEINKGQDVDKEKTLVNASLRFFSTHTTYSPKVFRKHPKDASTYFVLFKPGRTKPAEQLMSALSKEGFYAYVSKCKDGGEAVYVNLKK